MMKTIARFILMLSLVALAYAAQDVVTAVHGTIKAIDSTTRTIVVKTADGSEHSLRVLDTTAVHGGKMTAEASQESWHGLKDGTNVVVHYAKRGSEDTAVEIDRVGRDGLKTTDGTIRDFDRGGRKLVVRTSDGAESTFRLTDHSAEDAGKDVAEETEKGTKVIVYYSEEAGKKVAHFFERG